MSMNSGRGSRGAHAVGASTAQRQAGSFDEDEGLDIQATLDWLRRHGVVLAGLALIVAQMAWRAVLLRHLYFTQDDFYNLNLAANSPLTWHYLTFVGIGHLMIGSRLITWLVAHEGLYHWGLASAILLLLQAGAALAALRALRTLFGNRPAILVPVAMYLLAPLTVPALGWWSVALESVPLQIAIFMAVNAHVWYVRTGRAWHLAAAAFWLCFGLVFFEKALALPVLLFLLTAGFLTGDGPILLGAWRAIARYWRAWLVYLLPAAVGLVLVLATLKTSVIKPQLPPSAGAVATYAWKTAWLALSPGVLGGPWRWFPIFGGSYSLAAPTALLARLAVVGVVLVIGASILRRKTAWRAWAILAVWVALADLLPVAFGARISGWGAGLRPLTTHYLADAMAILAICLGLALLPVTGGRDGPSAALIPAWFRPTGEQRWRQAATAVFAVFIVSSIWSAQTYQDATTGAPAATYIANAAQAIRLAPRGAVVLDAMAPDFLVNSTFGKYQYTSSLVGDMETGRMVGKLRWTGHPHGTIDGLATFGTDGRLYPAVIFGTSSVPRTVKQGCWPERNGRIVVRFAQPSSIYSWELRIGYVLYSPGPVWVGVRYGEKVQLLQLRHGLHSAFLPVNGSAKSIVMRSVSGVTLCLGDAEAGVLTPDLAASALP